MSLLTFASRLQVVSCVYQATLYTKMFQMYVSFLIELVFDLYLDIQVGYDEAMLASCSPGEAKFQRSCQQTL